METGRCRIRSCRKDFELYVSCLCLPVQDLQEQKGKLEKHRKDDIKDAQQEKERLKTLTLGCVKQLGQCLAAQDGNPGNQGGGLTQVACRFLVPLVRPQPGVWWTLGWQWEELWTTCYLLTLVDLFLQPSFALTISSFARLALFNVLSFIVSACSPASFNIHGHVELHIMNGSTKLPEFSACCASYFSFCMGSVGICLIWSV